MPGYHYFSFIALLSFAIATIAYLGKSPRQKQLAWIFLGSGAVLSAYAAWVQGSHTLAGCTTALWLSSLLAGLGVIGHLQFHMQALGVFIAPLLMIILTINFFTSRCTKVILTVDELPWLQNSHVTLSIIGQAFAVCAAGIGILFLWQQKNLKARTLQRLPANFPALDFSNRILHLALWGAFIFLTFGLISGAFYVQMANLTHFSMIKVIWALATWLWYLIILGYQHVGQAPQKRMAQMSLLGFMLLSLSYFGMLFS